MIVKSRRSPKIILESFESSKMGAYESVNDFIEHIVDASETALRRCNPKFGKLNDEVSLRLVWYVVRKLPSNRP